MVVSIEVSNSFIIKDSISLFLFGIFEQIVIRYFMNIIFVNIKSKELLLLIMTQEFSIKIFKFFLFMNQFKVLFSSIMNLNTGSGEKLPVRLLRHDFKFLCIGVLINATFTQGYFISYPLFFSLKIKHQISILDLLDFRKVKLLYIWQLVILSFDIISIQKWLCMHVEHFLIVNIFFKLFYFFLSLLNLFVLFGRVITRNIQWLKRWNGDRFRDYLLRWIG